ncbi:DUF397 domain-containing protein [Streptomyces sp. CRN 30]|uniref:DUF397 domain-containing protein n=1 Tax=Streptomyces sp. CRN 30 TaxID=3075613 RepID=UPI002A8195E0|nr:DUF397 domain-containing protein [Streptomyces sp. CRN 30]
MDWRKSTYSGGGEGNSCVEIAGSATRVAIRDSKAPDRVMLSVRASSFVIFVESVKRDSERRSRDAMA